MPKQLTDHLEHLQTDLLRARSFRGLALPRGAASRQIEVDAGERPVEIVSTLLLTTARRLEPRDFYVECEAGFPLASLYDLLAEHSLKFPFLGQDATGTLGGMVASGQISHNGKWHNVSRWIIAVEALLADGTVARTGAVTFKSVAGYDLTRLFCGSFGTLGIIISAALRLFPQNAIPYGKDTEPVPQRLPLLVSAELSPVPSESEQSVARRIKKELDPDGLFPVIDSWNVRSG